MLESPLQCVVCCLGYPVAGNPHQFIVERAFAAAGLDWRYLTLEVPAERLEDAVRGLRGLGFRGAHVLTPHKQAVCTMLDELTELAARTSLVSCIVNRQGQLCGENLDGAAFVACLQEFTQPTGKHVTLFGAGAMASSIAFALASAGIAKLTIVNRSPHRADELAQALNVFYPGLAGTRPWNNPFALDDDTELIINATPLGEHDSGRVPVSPASLRPEIIVADVVLNPWRTEWLRMAQERGCTTLDGLAILLQQLALSFQLWTGQTADLRLMRDAAEEYLDI